MVKNGEFIYENKYTEMDNLDWAVLEEHFKVANEKPSAEDILSVPSVEDLRAVNDSILGQIVGTQTCTIPVESANTSVDSASLNEELSRLYAAQKEMTSLLKTDWATYLIDSNTVSYPRLSQKDLLKIYNEVYKLTQI